MYTLKVRRVPIFNVCTIKVVYRHMICTTESVYIVVQGPFRGFALETYNLNVKEFFSAEWVEKTS